ncbi:MAG: B12-binding domain-containing radical SAM protein [Candidatus Scalindua sp.]|nr:B12-binding domain-containing radical SAM protein [Candidatus Scalindua sp.]
MKILLVNPFQIHLVNKKGRIYNRTWTPLDLANCGAILEREGIDVAILDANAEQYGPDEVAKRAIGYDKVFITSTSLDRWQCPFLDINPFLETVKALKGVVSEVYVAGSHGTVRPVEMLEVTGARAIIRGEPELTVLDLCNNSKLSEICGITYQAGKEVLSNPDQTPVNLNELPIPAFHLLPMEKYNYEIMGNHFCLFEMTRGCASKCGFCLLKPYGSGVRRKYIDRLIPEIEYAINKFGVRKAYFMDLEFTFLRNQVMDLCEYLIKTNYKFQWCCQTRFDLVDEELLHQMKKAGCRLIHFGVEAGSDRMLEIINKGITMKDIREGMKKVKTVGINTACFFMIGFQESEWRDMEDIIKFAKEISPDYPVFHIVAPYPGTVLYERVKENGEVNFSDNSLFPEAIVGNFTLDELRKITRKAYFQYYFRPSYILSRLAKGQFDILQNQCKLFWSFVKS